MIMWSSSEEFTWLKPEFVRFFHNCLGDIILDGSAIGIIFFIFPVLKKNGFYRKIK